MWIFLLQDRCDGIVDSALTILSQFVGLKNTPLSLSQTNQTALHNSPFRTR